MKAAIQIAQLPCDFGRVDAQADHRS